MDQALVRFRKAAAQENRDRGRAMGGAMSLRPCAWHHGVCIGGRVRMTLRSGSRDPDCGSGVSVVGCRPVA
jgi:hypothetical protein